MNPEELSTQRNINAYSGLLRGSKTFVSRNNRRTLLEIAGVGCREVSSSKILCFFLNPKEDHGFGTLVLEALLQATGFASKDAESLNVENVECEHATKRGNLIDIWIETGRAVIAVENKIDHEINNPFLDYFQCARDFAGRRQPIGILLSLRVEEQPCKEFRAVTYSQLFSAFRSLRAERFVSADPWYARHFEDFMTTIENLSTNERAKVAIQKFLGKDGRLGQFLDLKRLIDELADDLRARVAVVSESLKLPKGSRVDFFGPLRNNGKKRVDFVYDSVKIELRTSKRELILQIWVSIGEWGYDVFEANWREITPQEKTKLNDLLKRNCSPKPDKTSSPEQIAAWINTILPIIQKHSFADKK